MTLASPSHSSADDPLAWRLELHEALSQPALARFEGDETVDPGLAHRAAYRLAAALGQCRLFGIDLSGEDGSLRPALALAAARQWGDYLKHWIADARQLGQRWEQALDESEATDQAIDLLVARMESWAVFLAVDEGYQESLEGDSPERAGFADVLDSDLARLEEFDQELRSNIDLLSLAADTRLLENWRQLLADSYRQALPWWLDGTLEETARHVRDESLAWQPRRGAYNLLDEKWIPVLWRDGRPDRVGIRDALAQAHDIRQIAASNPMDNVSLLRFLLAVLQWCKPELNDAERHRLESGEGIAEDWLTRLGTEEMPTAEFNLLGDGHRFFQEKQLLADLLCEKQRQWDETEKKASAKRKKAPKQAGKAVRPTSLTDEDFRPIGDLLFEIPTATNVIHFRHVRDKQFGLCPACCALGIIRHCGWAPANRFYTAPVNGPSPAYALRQGATLLQTLASNLPSAPVFDQQPPWLSNNAPTAANLDTVTAFAWRSRRLWLDDSHTPDESCGNCGQFARVIKQLAFQRNWKQPFESEGQQKKFWKKDPHLVLEGDQTIEASSQEHPVMNSISEEVKASGRRQKQNGNKPKALTTLGFPDLASDVSVHVRLWRRVLRAEIARANDATNPPTIIVGATKQDFIYQDVTSVRQPAIAQNAVASIHEAVSLLFNLTEQLTGVLKRSTPNPDRQHPNRKAALEGLTAQLEAGLRAELNRCLGKESTVVSLTSTEMWRDRVKTQLRAAISDTVSATTSGSRLRRREAQGRAWQALDAAMNRVSKAGQENVPSAIKTVPATDKSKRQRGKTKNKEAGA